MRFLSRAFLNLPLEHPDYWRARLVTWILLLAILLFSVLFVLNAFYFKDLDVTIIDGMGLLLASCIYFNFRRNSNIHIACWATVVLVVATLMPFVILVGGYSHSLFWATLIPPIAFFLIGVRWGTIISALCLSVCIVLVYQQVQSQKEVVFGMGALFNVIEVCIAHILLFRFYEHSRASAFKQLSAQNQQILTLSETDKLTQLYNRDKLDSSLAALSQLSIKAGQPLSVMMLDIDHFKAINDELGHLQGDKVLSELAAILKANMRKQDVLARWGGEEFIILLQNTSLRVATEMAQRLRIQISQTTMVNRSITISVGVGEFRPPESTDALIERVDRALYKAKREGRNKVSVSAVNKF